MYICGSGSGPWMRPLNQLKFLIEANRSPPTVTVIETYGSSTWKGSRPWNLWSWPLSSMVSGIAINVSSPWKPVVMLQPFMSQWLWPLNSVVSGIEIYGWDHWTLWFQGLKSMVVTTELYGFSLSAVLPASVTRSLAGSAWRRASSSWSSSTMSSWVGLESQRNLEIWGQFLQHEFGPLVRSCPLGQGWTFPPWFTPSG
jgi:hypothetical protein